MTTEKRWCGSSIKSIWTQRPRWRRRGRRTWRLGCFEIRYSHHLCRCRRRCCTLPRRSCSSPSHYLDCPCILHKHSYEWSFHRHELKKKMQNWNRIILLWKRMSWCQFGNMQFSNHSCWPIKHQNLDFEDSHFNFMNFLCIVKVFHFAIFLFQFDDWNDWNSFLKSRKTFGGFKKLWNGRFLIKKSWNWIKNPSKISFNHFDGFFLLA